MKKLLKKIFPRGSIRRLVVTIIRDFLIYPPSLFRRLSATNRMNNIVASKIIINCNICGSRSKIHYDFPDIHLRASHGIGILRETLSCKCCNGSMRDRQMAHGLIAQLEAFSSHKIVNLSEAKNLKNAAILDTDSFSPINRMLRGVEGYQYSQYIPHLENGIKLRDGSFNVDLLRMPFDDFSYDIIMTSDVMEHVSKDHLAHSEIYRCLRWGGAYIFTVPFNPSMYGNRRLTQPTLLEGGDFVLEHHTHGDPHSGDGIVAHRIYGQQIFADLERIGFDVELLDIINPEAGIFGGDLFIAKKFKIEN